MIITWRVYEKPFPDGYKILVDRLWPRGIRKIQIDYWAKDIAPSDELRTWFSHDIEKWDEFLENYRKELSENKKLDEILEIIRDKGKIGDIIFLYAAKEKNFNNAIALKLIIEPLL